MNRSVTVLMSVYFPDWRFLEEQLWSVLEQEEVSVSLLIRDDTGDDGYLIKLKEFLQKRFPLKKNVKVISGANLGPAKSFLELCYQAALVSEYYAFCDQDDVWASNKLIRAIECIEQNGVGLYASTLNVVDESLTFISQTDKPTKISFENSFTENVVTGCVVVFDRQVMSMVLQCRPSYIAMHDHWLYMIATAFSHVFYDEDSFIKYRQHSGNVVGAKNIYYYYKKFIRFFEGRQQDKKRINDQVKSFCLCYDDLVDSDKQQQLRRFLSMEGRFFHRVANLWRYSRNGFVENLIFKIKFIIGTY